MKKILVIVIGLIIALHAFLFLFFLRPLQKELAETKLKLSQEQEKSAKAAEAPAAAEAKNVLIQPPPAAPLPVSQAPAAPGASAAPAPILSLPWVEPVPFSPTYFHIATRPLPGKLQALAQNCKAGIAVDLSSKTIYWSKNGGATYTIASLTKMMTSYLAVRKMRSSNGKITLNTPIQVTRTASKIGGRQVWLDPKESFTFDEILKATMIHSANDCAYLLAEFMGGGSEDSFVAEMNQYARQIGCTHFRFLNAHGLPIKEQRNAENSGTAIELAYLADQLLKVPEITKWTCKKTEYLRQGTSKPTQLVSSNPLLGRCPGVTGMKTGLTDRSGMCLVATCERNGRQVCIVLLGCQGKAVRNPLAFGLVNWVYTL